MEFFTITENREGRIDGRLYNLFLKNDDDEEAGYFMFGHVSAFDLFCWHKKSRVTLTRIVVQKPG